jgi:hypothetical protein
MRNSDQRMNKYQDLKQQNVSTAASDNRLSVQGKGEIAINTANGHVQVKDVLHVPNLSENLMSVSQLVNKDFIVVFAREDCKIYHKNYVKIEGVHLFKAPNVSKVDLGQVDSNIKKNGKRADNFKTWQKN